MTYITHNTSYKVSWGLASFNITYNDYDGYFYFITNNYSSQNIIARSKDFKTYETLYTKTTTGSSAISYIYYCYEKNILIVTGYGPTFMYSTDGTTWKNGTYNGTTSGYIYVYQPYYYNGKLYAFYSNTQNGTYGLVSSSNGITWTLGTTTSVNFNPVINTEGGFAYYYNQSDYYMYINRDLSTWQNLDKYTKTGLYIQYNTIVYAADKNCWYIIHKEYNSTPWIQYSSDLSTLNIVTNNNFASLVKSSDTINQVSYFNGVFVVTTYNGVMIYSTNCTNWYSFTNNFVGSNQIYHANCGGKLLFQMGTSSNDYKIAYCTNAGWPNLNYIE